MSQQQVVQPHQQDDCEDCQKQRAQNNKLIDFYERLHKIKTKVTEIKPGVALHTNASNEQRKKLMKISEKIAQPLNYGELSKYDTKEMGYQLTCALLQREIKIKKQNQFLSKRVRQLKDFNENIHQNIKKVAVVKKDSQMQSQPQQFKLRSNSQIHRHETQLQRSKEKDKNNNSLLRKKQSGVSDSLDNAIQDTNKSFWGANQTRSNKAYKTYENNSRYSYPFTLMDNHGNQSSTFSSFEQTGRTVFSPISKQQGKKKVEELNLNLWLYQYNIEQQIPKSNRSSKQKVKIREKK